MNGVESMLPLEVADVSWTKGERSMKELGEVDVLSVGCQRQKPTAQDPGAHSAPRGGRSRDPPGTVRLGHR
jgi:hypothetical protein